MAAKKVILAVIDGLTPGLLERGVEEGRLPALSFLLEAGTYARGVTTFPSVTPVCLSSIATGVHPDRHRIPHLAWYHRGESRVIEYGSSFHAMRAVGARQAFRDSVFNMSHQHLSPHVTTVFEAVEDGDLTAAAVNFTCYRGRARHAIRLPGLAARNRWYEAVYGPKRFFFFNLFESDETGAPLAVRSRLAGSIDAYAGVVGRWLVTRDGFDFLLFYLPDLDYASHLSGPTAPVDALERADAALGGLMDAAGGPDQLLERYAVIVCSDHGQSHVEVPVRLQDAFADLAVFTGRRRTDPRDAEVAVTASNRSGMIYRLPGCRYEAADLARRLDAEPAVELALYREGEDAVARLDGEEVRFGLDDRDALDGDLFPNGVERAWRALACSNAGDVIVSAREGFEFLDLGGRHHAGGGSHGSLAAADSTVPIVAAGFDRPPLRDRPDLVELAPALLDYLGVRAAVHA